MLLWEDYPWHSRAQIRLSRRKSRQVATPRKPMARNSPAAPGALSGPKEGSPETIWTKSGGERLKHLIYQKAASR